MTDYKSVLVIVWIKVKSVNFLLAIVDLPVIRSLKCGLLDCDSGGEVNVGHGELWTIQEQ